MGTMSTTNGVWKLLIMICILFGILLFTTFGAANRTSNLTADMAKTADMEKAVLEYMTNVWKFAASKTDSKYISEPPCEQSTFIWDLDSENQFYDAHGEHKVFCLFDDGPGRVVPVQSQELFINCNKNFPDWAYNDFEYYLTKYPPKWIFCNPNDESLDRVTAFIDQLKYHSKSKNVSYFVFVSLENEGEFDYYYKFDNSSFIGTNDNTGSAIPITKLMLDSRDALWRVESKRKYYILCLSQYYL